MRFMTTVIPIPLRQMDGLSRGTGIFSTRQVLHLPGIGTNFSSQLECIG
jgi:hypothetical protein